LNTGRDVTNFESNVKIFTFPSEGFDTLFGFALKSTQHPWGVVYKTYNLWQQVDAHVRSGVLVANVFSIGVQRFMFLKL
jgi:hypothetical protein